MYIGIDFGILNLVIVGCDSEGFCLFKIDDGWDVLLSMIYFD